MSFSSTRVANRLRDSLLKNGTFCSLVRKNNCYMMQFRSLSSDPIHCADSMCRCNTIGTCLSRRVGGTLREKTLQELFLGCRSIQSSAVRHGPDSPQDIGHKKKVQKQEEQEKDSNSSGSTISAQDLELALKATAEPDSDPPSDTQNTRTTDPLSNIEGAQTGGRKLAIVFTCNVCQTRSAKKFTEQAYRHGVVLVRCPTCENLHLIADRLGYFEDKGDGGWDVETFLKEKGVRTIRNEDVIEMFRQGE